MNWDYVQYKKNMIIAFDAKVTFGLNYILAITATPLSD